MIAHVGKSWRRTGATEGCHGDNDAAAAAAAAASSPQVLPTLPGGPGRWALTAFLYRPPPSAANHPQPSMLPAAADPPEPAAAGPAAAGPAGAGPAGSAPLILVSVASYRDSECPHTVADCLAQADQPNRIRIVVVRRPDTPHAHPCTPHARP